MSDESDFYGSGTGHDTGTGTGTGHDERSGSEVLAPEQILCVDCGGTCHLLTRPYLEEDGSQGFRPGDIVAYRCSDCLDRWDIELE